MTDATTPTRSDPPTPHDPPTSDGPAVIVTCTSTYPLHGGDGRAFVFHLLSEAPYPTLIEVTSADPNRYRVGDLYTLTITPPGAAVPARPVRPALPARRPAPSVEALRAGLGGKVSGGVPAALFGAVTDVLAVCEPHRSTGARTVAVREIDEVIAWRLRDYLPDRVSSPSPVAGSVASGSRTP